MGAERMRALSVDEAAAQYERMPIALRPATLHPAYVIADAARNPLLQPLFLSYEEAGECWLHSLHRTDVPGMTLLRDASSPYGYGGPVCSTDHAGFVAAAWHAYLEWMRADGVVVEYIRFHPMLGNERHYGGNVTDSRAVVCVDLEQDDITAGYAVRQRQALKKAAGAGLVYEEADLAPMVREFAAFYRAGMTDIGADPFYLFADSYFEALAASGLARVGCSRSPGEQWLAAALFLDGHGMREYHLAATSAEGRKASASTFVLHRGALAARARGLRRLYLGGGSDVRPDNPLLFFKSSFSPQRLTYRTGWNVFDAKRYDELERRFAHERAAHPERPIFHRIV
jgi:hypothetical protein